MNRRPRRAGVVLGGTVAIILLGSTSAVAYWTTMGSGSGAAAADTFKALTVSARDSHGAGPVPRASRANGTSTGGTLSMVASNPNPFPVTVVGLPERCRDGVHDARRHAHVRARSRWRANSRAT